MKQDVKIRSAKLRKAFCESLDWSILDKAPGVGSEKLDFICDNVGISHKNLDRILDGRYAPSLDVVLAILDVCKLDFVFSYEISSDIDSKQV